MRPSTPSRCKSTGPSTWTLALDTSAWTMHPHISSSSKSERTFSAVLCPAPRTLLRLWVSLLRVGTVRLPCRPRRRPSACLFGLAARKSLHACRQTSRSMMCCRKRLPNSPSPWTTSRASKWWAVMTSSNVTTTWQMCVTSFAMALFSTFFSTMFDERRSDNHPVKGTRLLQFIVSLFACVFVFLYPLLSFSPLPISHASFFHNKST
mmetsp:Transcript_37900/g.95267  ORF Transcript_37900/g.95267 Transcript_37900/m.95267 type:complete len:207 (+) Transcript_37900:173-793(+)